MAKPNIEKEHPSILQCVRELKKGQIPPWKAEENLAEKYGITQPLNFKAGALCRQRYIEEVTGEKFCFIQIPEKPYKQSYTCPEHNLIWEIEAKDTDLTCSLCGSKLESSKQTSALVSNYIGGQEDYYSYAGRIKVTGTIQKEFTNLLVYGTGLGPIGVTRGCFLINKFGGAYIQTSESARAARCLGFIFLSEKSRNQAIHVIENNLPELISKMDAKMTEFSGRTGPVEFGRAESRKGFILYVEFIADFKNARGHGDISRAVGFAKHELEKILNNTDIEYKLSMIAQGYDGDLKPSPRNKRGRFASASVRIPLEVFQDEFGTHPDRFLEMIEVDKTGSQKLGCQFYSGMGGEIIPAVYRATKLNPRSCLVSSFQNTFAGVDGSDLVYTVELPNIESGIVSCREGLIPPTGREALRIMGVRTSEEFSASLAAQVLAGEFNLALEIAREKLYKP